MDLATASTIPPTRLAAEPETAGDAPVGSGPPVVSAGVSEATAVEGKAAPEKPQHTGSLAQRMMLIASAWIIVLLLLGGLALDRTLASLVTRSFDDQLGYMLTGMIGSAEIGPDGEVFFNRPLGDQRFLEPNSGLYWQITGKGHEDFP